VADLGGRVAIVTGASSGIGEATARALAADGARVALCARRKDRLERLAAEIQTRGGEAAAHPLDVTDAPAVHAMVEAVAARWGRVDVFVNNAGRGLVATLEQTTVEELRALLDVEPQKIPWRRRGPVQSAEQVARAIARCTRRPRPEVYPYWPSRLLAVLSVIAPGLVNSAMRPAVR